MGARGRFITFEGIDGAGKTTHIEWLGAYLERLGHDVVRTREPGGTTLGETLRDLVLHQAMTLETEALLMFAARSEHISQLIEPALARGAWVISDRFTDASFAYQGGGRGLGQSALDALEAGLPGGLRPDRTFLFDLPVAVAQARLASARVPDNFERQSPEFFERVRREYLRRATMEPDRFIVIDAAQSREFIQNSLEECVSTL